jgi:hypothetical protein
MAKMPAAPTKEILEAALQGLESQRQRLDSQIAQVRAMMGNRPGRPSKQSISNDGVKPATATKKATRKRRVLSPEARKRIAVAQKKRWAAFRKTQE